MSVTCLVRHSSSNFEELKNKLLALKPIRSLTGSCDSELLHFCIFSCPLSPSHHECLYIQMECHKAIGSQNSLAKFVILLQNYLNSPTLHFFLIACPWSWFHELTVFFLTKKPFSEMNTLVFIPSEIKVCGHSKLPFLPPAFNAAFCSLSLCLGKGENEWEGVSNSMWGLLQHRLSHKPKDKWF